MTKKRRKLEYERPVTAVELTNLPSGSVGRRLRSRLDRSHVLVEQATGLLAEKLHVSLEEARDVLIQDAAARGLTMRAAAERVLHRKG